MSRISRLLVFMLALISASLAASSPRHLTPRAAYDFQTRRLENFFRNKTPDEAALRSIYTRDAILVEANGNTIRGRDRIARHFRQVLASGAVASFAVTTTTFRSQGAISYAGGYEDITENSADGPRHGRNRFFVLLRREPDGIWRFDYILEASADRLN